MRTRASTDAAALGVDEGAVEGVEVGGGESARIDGKALFLRRVRGRMVRLDVPPGTDCQHLRPVSVEFDDEALAWWEPPAENPRIPVAVGAAGVQAHVEPAVPSAPGEGTHDFAVRVRAKRIARLHACVPRGARGPNKEHHRKPGCGGERGQRPHIGITALRARIARLPWPTSRRPTPLWLLASPVAKGGKL